MALVVAEHLGEAPALEFRNRPGLFDADLVADRSLALFVVGVELLRALDDLLEFGVRHASDELHHDGFVHPGRDHDARPLFAQALFFFDGIRHEIRLVRCLLCGGLLVALVHKQ